MKRFGNLYDSVCDIDNLILAESRARKGKRKKKDVKLFDENKQDNLISLHHLLLNKEYKTSLYSIFTIFDKKERIIYKLPYYPDRIAHHAIMNVIESVFVSSFTSNTYSCIKGRGIHKAQKDLIRALDVGEGTKYCLKLDVKKFYPSINHDILKHLLKKKFKDLNLLNLLDEIIDSADGVPIGNYLSQYFANFYLTYFDHWLKETKKVKFYFRYCDDIVILGDSKESLRLLLYDIIEYLYNNLRLKVKSNYQIFPVDDRGIDFVGYRFYHNYILLRKSIKKNFVKMILHNNNWKSRASYKGWLDHCNSVNLKRKYLNEK